MRARDYVLGTGIGSLPGAAAYVTIGAYGATPGSLRFVLAVAGLVVLAVGGLVAAGAFAAFLATAFGLMVSVAGVLLTDVLRGWARDFRVAGLLAGLVATVIGLAERDGRRWAHLDVGAFNGFMEALESGNRLRFPVGDSRGGRREARSRAAGEGPGGDPGGRRPRTQWAAQ